MGWHLTKYREGTKSILQKRFIKLIWRFLFRPRFFFCFLLTNVQAGRVRSHFQLCPINDLDLTLPTVYNLGSTSGKGVCLQTVQYKVPTIRRQLKKLYVHFRHACWNLAILTSAVDSIYLYCCLWHFHLISRVYHDHRPFSTTISPKSSNGLSSIWISPFIFGQAPPQLTIILSYWIVFSEPSRQWLPTPDTYLTVFAHPPEHQRQWGWDGENIQGLNWKRYKNERSK